MPLALNATSWSSGLLNQRGLYLDAYNSTFTLENRVRTAWAVLESGGAAISRVDPQRLPPHHS